MAKFEQYIDVGKRRLRLGYSTGTCAAAAAGGAVRALLGGAFPEVFIVETPAGITVEAELSDCTLGDGFASCAVRKDGGDDIDATDGMLIYARVELSDDPGEVSIDGGEGIGRVTRPGLDQPVGNAAINTVPREMIEREMRFAAGEYQYTGGMRVVISAPEGETVAKRTFNSRLGILGGVSILGTTGIVRPMSEQALLDTIRVELSMLYASGERRVVLYPGNYGKDFAVNELKLRPELMISCSNYLGEVIDYAAVKGFESLLLVGNFGKLIKVAGGVMNTHSRIADGRREIMAAHTAMAGGRMPLVKRVYGCLSTDEALDILAEAGILHKVMESVTGAFEENLRHRAGESMRIEGLFFSNKHGILGKTDGADELLTLDGND